MNDHPLRQAYEATDCRVGDRFTIRGGRLTPPLDALLADEGHDSWAFITAWNSGSIALDDAANRRRMEALGRAFGQVANVGGRRGEPARLCFCWPSATPTANET
jgi:hypothetical protein